MRAALRENWINLLKAHLIRDMRGKHVIEHSLLSFDGLAVCVRTKMNHLVGDEFHLQDLESLVVISRAPWKEFKPRWDRITRIEFLYLRPPSPDVRALLTGKQL